MAYLAFAIFLTWPLTIRLDSAIYGPVGDLTGASAMFRELIESGSFPFAPGALPDFNAPSGLDIRWTLNILTLPSFTTLYTLSALFGPIAAINIYTLLGFTLSGVAMFMLVRRLVGDTGAALVAGFVYAFYPLMVLKAQVHVDFVHGWVFVLALWRLLETMEHPTRRNGVWAGLALVLAFAWTPYHILLAGVMALLVGIVGLGFAIRRKQVLRTFGAFALAATIAATFVGGMVLLNHAGPRDEIRHHTLDEAIAFAARAEEYVIPTGEHPIFGKQAGEYRASHGHGSNYSENMLYVGATVLLLALVGLIASLRRSDAPRRTLAVASLLAIGGFAFSAPPEVNLLGTTFPTTTKLLFDLTTTWRVFARFGIVVMLGLALLAGLGVAAIVRGRRPIVRVGLLALIVCVVAADLWARPAGGANELRIPSTYERLAKLPDGIVAEYPLLPAERSFYGDTFFQGWYDKPVLNGYYEGSPEENRALRLGDLSNPETVRGLRALGVRYVLLRRDLSVVGIRVRRPPRQAFRPIVTKGDILLYEVVSRRPEVLISPMEGFAGAEGNPERPFQWLLHGEGTVELRGSCSPCRGTASMAIESFARPRIVTVLDTDGHVLARKRITKRGTLKFSVTFDRKLVLRLEADPGVQQIGRTIGTDDPRYVTVAVTDQSFKFRQTRP